MERDGDGGNPRRRAGPCVQNPISSRQAQVQDLYWTLPAGRFILWGMESYQQFCPVARAAEILTRKWMPLVVREILCGSHRFNDIHRGVPRMSRSLLSRRLAELEQAGLVERRGAGEDGHPEYHLTQAGEELRPIIVQLGAWGKRWIRSELSRDHLDAGLLMWNLQRRVEPERLPERRVVVHFHFTDGPGEYRNFWLVLQRQGVDLCLRDPGYECDLQLTTDVGTLTAIWLGDDDFARAMRDGALRMRGRRELRQQLPRWLQRDPLAGVPRTA